MPIDYDPTGRNTVPEKIEGHSGKIVALGTAFAFVALAVTCEVQTGAISNLIGEAFKPKTETLDLR